MKKRMGVLRDMRDAMRVTNNEIKANKINE